MNPDTPSLTTLNPESNASAAAPQLWSRQPGEPAADYQLFAAWLQLPAPRPARGSAASLGCSVHRLRQCAARHCWKTRAAAFDNYRADAASRALDELLAHETKDWGERARVFRLQEWLLHERMMEAAWVVMDKFERHPGRASLTDLVRVLELASRLGRRACGLPLDPADALPPPESPAPCWLEIQAAIRKVYGDDAAPGKQ